MAKFKCEKCSKEQEAAEAPVCCGAPMKSVEAAPAQPQAEPQPAATPQQPAPEQPAAPAQPAAQQQ